MSSITIIMPSLNVAKYIEKSISSVVAQSCFSDLEVLIVDAGSMDGTKEIVGSYAKKYDNITLIDCPIRSYGYQVNLAVRQAQGEYVAILDTDDFVEPDAYQSLYAIAKNGNYDYVKGGKVSYYSDDILGDKEVELYSRKDIDKYFERGLLTEDNAELFSIDWNIWNGIYRSGIFKEVQLSETKGAAFQDIGGVFRLLYRSKNCFLTNKLVYHYRVDNINSSSYNPDVFKYSLYEYSSLLEEFSSASRHWKESILIRLAMHVVGLLEQAAERNVDYNTIAQAVSGLCDILTNAVKESLISEENIGRSWNELMEVLENNKAFYFKCIERFKKEDKALRDIVESVRKKPAIVFGAGRYGQFVALTIKKDFLYHFGQDNAKALELVFADNSTEKQGTSVDGIPIVSLAEAKEVYPQARYIIAVKYHENEIINQLIGYGISRDQITSYTYRASWIIPMYADDM